MSEAKVERRHEDAAAVALLGVEFQHEIVMDLVLRNIAQALATAEASAQGEAWERCRPGHYPLRGEHVLVTTVARGRFIAWLEGDMWLDGSGSHELTYITHWAPLPPPPKAEP